MIWVIGIFIVAALFSRTILKHVTSETIQVTVNDKERITDGENSKYLVYTDKEVFKNVDDYSFLKFNSSDVQNDLKIGETYTVKVCGVRWPFMSWYRNIVKIE